MSEVDEGSSNGFLEEEDITDGDWQPCDLVVDSRKRKLKFVFKLSIILWYAVLSVLIVITLGLSISANESPAPGGTNSKRELLDQMHVILGDRYNAPHVSIDIVSAMRSVQSVYANNELNPYMGCNETTSECTVDHTIITAMPSFVSCDTPTRPLTEPGFTNTDVYCSIDNTVGETNPIVATLDISGGQIKCVCSLVALSNPTPGTSVCKLHVRRCPDTIQLNTWNVH